MPGVINTGSHPALLWPGIKGIWGYIYKQWATEYTDLADTTQSDKDYELYQQVAGFGFAQIKNQGAAIEYDIEQQGAITRLMNITFALGYIVTMEEMQDNLYEKVSKRRAAANARSMRITKEYVVANMYNRAFTAGFTGGDGVVLGSAAHPLVFGGTFSNVPAVPADLSEVALEDGCIQIMGLQDDRGMAAAFMPRSLHISRSELFNATRILKSEFQSGTGNNDVNALKMTGMFPQGIKVNHYFSAARPWFIRTTGVDEGNGMIYQERMAVEFDQDNEFSTKNVAAASVERYQVGWGDPRAVLCVDAP